MRAVWRWQCILSPCIIRIINATGSDGVCVALEAFSQGFRFDHGRLRTNCLSPSLGDFSLVYCSNINVKCSWFPIFLVKLSHWYYHYCIPIWIAVALSGAKVPGARRALAPMHAAGLSGTAGGGRTSTASLDYSLICTSAVDVLLVWDLRTCSFHTILPWRILVSVDSVVVALAVRTGIEWTGEWIIRKSIHLAQNKSSAELAPRCSII